MSEMQANACCEGPIPPSGSNPPSSMTSFTLDQTIWHERDCSLHKNDRTAYYRVTITRCVYSYYSMRWASVETTRSLSSWLSRAQLPYFQHPSAPFESWREIRESLTRSQRKDNMHSPETRDCPSGVTTSGEWAAPKSQEGSRASRLSWLSGR